MRLWSAIVATEAMVLVFGLIFLLTVPALAVGPVVGTNCVVSWGAVTTHTDGTPVTGTITYSLYLSTGTPATPPATPTITGITGTSSGTSPCSTLTAGQYTAWVSAVEQLAGSSSESAKSAPFPFVLGVPTTPNNINVR